MEHPRAYGVDESGERRDREWMAGEFVTRGSRRQRNSVSWPDERAAMLDRTVIDRGLGGGERKPRRCHLARGTAGCSNEISIPSRGSSRGRSGLSAACEIGRSYVSLAETAGRPSLHKRNAKFVARSFARPPARSLVRSCARARTFTLAFRVARVVAIHARRRGTTNGTALHNGHVFFLSFLDRGTRSARCTRRLARPVEQWHVRSYLATVTCSAGSPSRRRVNGDRELTFSSTNRGRRRIRPCRDTGSTARSTRPALHRA